jgi:mannosyl-glycoprotein endo-beta-N-acetylglucosaminidase
MERAAIAHQPYYPLPPAFLPCSLPPRRSHPLRSLQQLLLWQPGEDPLNVCHVPLMARPSSASSSSLTEPTSTLRRARHESPQVLHCHDMKGGYHDDSYPLGGEFGPLGIGHAYHFRHWPLIDIFVYFSHERIAIPPIGWITAAHRVILTTSIACYVCSVLHSASRVSPPFVRVLDRMVSRSLAC